MCIFEVFPLNIAGNLGWPPYTSSLRNSQLVAQVRGEARLQKNAGWGAGMWGRPEWPKGLLCAHLHLSVAVPSLHVAPILHHVLNQLPSWGGSQDCGIILLLKYTHLVADGNPVTGREKEQGGGERLGGPLTQCAWVSSSRVFSLPKGSHDCHPVCGMGNSTFPNDGVW